MSDSITCPYCQQTSYSLGDIQNKFCLNCGFHDENIVMFFTSQGYERPVWVQGVGWCMVNRYIHSHGVLLGATRDHIPGRICFDTKLNAYLFLGELIEHGSKVKIPNVGDDGCTAHKF